jgi:hypothetical protein
MFMQDFTRSATRFSLAAPMAPVLAETLAAPLSGLIGGTLVETAQGWRCARSLRIGDRVQSWDGGAGGMLDTCSDLTLLPGQHILLDTLGDALLPDAQAVMLRAQALAGLPGVRQISLSGAEAVTPRFAEDEVIWAQSGALIHCSAISAHPGDGPQDGFFTCLAGSAARAFLHRRMAA